MIYTLKQAADATGLAKSTVQRAIKSGKISATFTDSGNYQIDPVELHRVFSPVERNTVQPVAIEQDAPDETASENRELRTRVELMGELIKQIESQRDDLRSERDRLLTVIQEQAGTVKQLTHQAERQTPEAKPQQPANKNAPAATRQSVRPWLWVALAVAVIVVGVITLLQRAGRF
jgi:excisionase family DNA binding protein